MRNPRARADGAEIARLDHVAASTGVLVREKAHKHEREDGDVSMPMRVIAAARRDALLVDREDRAEAEVLRVVVVSVAERMERRDAVLIGAEPIGGASNLDLVHAYPRA